MTRNPMNAFSPYDHAHRFNTELLQEAAQEARGRWPGSEPGAPLPQAGATPTQHLRQRIADLRLRLTQTQSTRLGV